MGMEKMKRRIIIGIALLSVFLSACSAVVPDAEGDDLNLTGSSLQNEESEMSLMKTDETIAEHETLQTMENGTENIDDVEEITEMKMNVQIGDAVFTATLEENDATRELVEMMEQGPVNINMDDYAGFEKVGPLGRNLTTNNHQTTTSAGDIVLYMGNQIVMFYGTNSWSYTRIGRIDDLTGWEDALGSGSITAVFTLAE